MTEQEKTLVKQALEDLNSGYILVCKNGATMRKSGRYIYWRHYGGSAIKNLLPQLHWLFVELLKIPIEYVKMTDDEFYDYQIATNYSVLLPY